MLERLQTLLGGLLDKIIYILPAIVIALVIHELAHSLVAYFLGDKSQKERGRLTLNPLRHIDPVGFICLFIFGFGWAKPVEVQPMYFKKPRVGMFISAIAGPLANFVFAFITSFFMVLLFGAFGIKNDYLYTFLYILMSLNIGLGIFNLIPFPPLDGSKLFYLILPPRAYVKFAQLERYGFIILLVLIMVFDVFSQGLAFLQSGVINGFFGFWENIFNLLRI